MIIISCVRSSQEYVDFDRKYNLGFLVNPKRFNVAITRAEALLVVIGNPKVLFSDSHWGTLVKHCIDQGVYTGAVFEEPGTTGERERACELVELAAQIEDEDEDEEPNRDEPSLRVQQEAGSTMAHHEE